MDYDDAVKHGKPSTTIQYRFLETFLQPFLKGKPGFQFLASFLHLSYQAWKLGITKDSLRNVSYVNCMCQKLAEKDEDAFAEFVTAILQETYDASERSDASERTYYNTVNHKDPYKRAAALLDHYRTYFDNEFRLWSSIPLYYVCSIYGITTKARTPRDFVSISAGTKYHTLKTETVACPHGDVREFLEGFNNDFRNAGGGHQDWEIDDDERIVLRCADPKSGAVKKTYTVTFADVEKQLKSCRVSIWYLHTGFLIFLNNHQSFFELAATPLVPKASQIEDSIRRFAEDRLFSLSEFVVAGDRSSVSLTLQHKPPVVGYSQSVFFSNGESYDIILIREDVPLADHLIDILRFLSHHFPRGAPLSVSISVVDRNGDSVCQISYDPPEVAQLRRDMGATYTPKPISGSIPTLRYSFISEVRVPSGFREVVTKQLIAEGKRVIQGPSDVNKDLF